MDCIGVCKYTFIRTKVKGRDLLYKVLFDEMPYK